MKKTKVRVSFTVEVDQEAWAESYDLVNSPRVVQHDVHAYMRGLIRERLGDVQHLTSIRINP